MRIHWRPLWRTASTLLLLAGFMGALAAFVAFTRHPDAPAIDRARSLPVVGGLVARLQDYYRPPRSPRETAASGEAGIVVEYVYHLEPPRSYVWAAAGTPIRRAPELASEELGRLDAMTNLFVDERRGEWVRVSHRGVEGWLLSPRGGRRTAVQAPRPAPVLPLPAQRVAAGVLERGLASFSTPAARFRLRPYEIYTDVALAPIRSACASPVERSETLYRDLYGVTPVGEAAETLFLFARRADYDAFSDATRSTVGSAGHAAGGFAGTYRGARSAGEVCGTLLHEIGHLLNRRALGPALPAWLGEGLAVDFEVAARDTRPPYELLAGDPRARGLRPLAALAALDDEAFFRQAQGGLTYPMAGLWIRFLRSDATVREGFAAFLAYLAAGGAWADSLGAEDFPAVRRSPQLTDDLLHFLGTDAAALDAGFNAWLWSRS